MKRGIECLNEREEENHLEIETNNEKLNIKDDNVEPVKKKKKRNKRKKKTEQNVNQKRMCERRHKIINSSLEIDFSLLNEKYPSFHSLATKNAKGKIKFDYSTAKGQRVLAEVILEEYFQLHSSFPPNHLPPSIPLRVNYINWIQYLITEELKLNCDNIRGIDIGTGASCIYPLIGVRLFNWSFLATEIDKESISFARENVKLNNFSDKIEIRFVNTSSSRPILLNVLLPSESYEFCMCNPPFFENLDEACLNTYRECEATNNELVTEGGESSFLIQLINESKLLHDRVKVYSSMVGKKKTMNSILHRLAQMGIKDPVYTAQFVQGRTSRWAIAWLARFDD